ncbi:MAG TPA: NrfD/PsrC family molybdoenzyme membrane anchor subunit [Caldilineaceae bacterium]|nr:NrfD/PsrC family molybdoenzyme membrane anchor subunit [Caldilineaceae bacterium]
MNQRSSVPAGPEPVGQVRRPSPGATAPVLAPGHTFRTVTDKISAIVLTGRTPLWWFIGFAISFALFMLFLFAVTYLLAVGTGIWGINIPVAWGFAIINFVWWVGIGHAGTLISAVLLLLRQEWRTSINRFAEAMTLFAVACAGLFPLLHMGRPWLFYWMLPYPNTMGLWPQWRSPLVWDVFAVGTYATISLLFWYVGLVPDLATLRDQARHPWLKVIYGVFAMGWRNAASHWQRYQTAYYLLAALATPLVISVHSVVGLDFAASVIPGWHTTVFPPYFVAGAVFSGFAMVMTIAIPLRVAFGLQDFITMRHLNNMAKVMLATGLMVGYGYMTELFIAWYSSNEYEWFVMSNRIFGPYAPAYLTMLLANVGVSQLLWSRRVRSNVPLLFVISLIINVGMWFERYVIVVTSLHRDFIPAAWGYYDPTFWDWATYLGTLGLFFSLLFLFIRVLPMISIFEMRELVAETEQEGGHMEPVVSPETQGGVVR